MTDAPIVRVRPEDDLDLRRLVTLSKAEGHDFVARTQEEWDSGANRFDLPGEGLFLAFAGTEVVGVCGLNRDPYLSDPGVGRLRHLYVAPSHRRKGIGRALVAACLELARDHFHRVRLRTLDEGAARFYERLGFTTADEDAATHSILV